MFPISQFTYPKKYSSARRKTDSVRNRSLLTYTYKLTNQEQNLSYAISVFSQNEVWSDQKRHIVDHLLSLQKTLEQIEKIIRPVEIHTPDKGKYTLITSAYFLSELAETISTSIADLPEKNLKTLVAGNAIKIRHHLEDLKTGILDLASQMNLYIKESL